MKFLGVQFTKFACFESKFISFDKQVLIFAGKNNSGKTALLRGLNALKSLPIGNVSALEQHLIGYKRPDQDGFGLNVWYSISDRDDSPFRDGDRSFLSGKTANLVFRFIVWPQENMVGLASADIQGDNFSLQVVERLQNGVYVQRRINERGEIPPSAIQLQERERRQRSDGPWAVLHANDVLAPLEDLKRIHFIDARRIAAPSMPAAEERTLAPDARNLGQYLLTLQNADRRTFHKIESFVTRVFPEFESLNPSLSGSTVSINFTLRGQNSRIPITHCGTGVEQLLTLATFFLTIPKQSTILLDEPHTYLHPTAEREYISLLLRDLDHKYIVSTHSAVMINTVPASSVISVSSREEGSFSDDTPETIGSVLKSLGYRNSDFLFCDRLVLVEGKSDVEIMPRLLTNAHFTSRTNIERTGFLKTEGADSPSSITKQTIILRYEKLIAQFEMSSIPRIYVRDGDASADERSTLNGTNQLGSNKSVPIAYLQRSEIENYLLVPNAIAQAIDVVRKLVDEHSTGTSPNEVATRLQGILGNTGDAKIFPKGVGTDPLKSCKGSVVLQRLFDGYGLRYYKEQTGGLIAQHINLENQPSLDEIVSLVRPLYE